MKNHDSAFNGAIKLRPMPYPFNAGLALCSDIDECDLETFIQLHRAINSKDHGLGLPMADSFFGIARRENHLAFYNPDGSSRPREAEFIVQAIQDGLIDSLHSWGDFNESPPEPQFLQSIARQLTGDLIKAGLQIPVWINHGSPDNHQNLFARLWPQYQGDDPKSPLYTLPFIKELGIKFYWWSEIAGWPLSANDSRAGGNKHRKRLAANKIKNIAKTILGKAYRKRPSGQITQLINLLELRDGNPLLAFTRFARHPERRKLWGPSRHTLRYNLTKEILDDLVQDQGFIIVYTHLAKPFPVTDEASLFPPEDEKALRLLAEYYKKELIWVAPTSKLLRFKMVHDHLQWRSVEDGDKIVIEITNLNDPVAGVRIPEKEELAGICFYSPLPTKTHVKIAGRDVSANILATDMQNGGWVGFDIDPAPKTGLVDG